MKPALIEGDDDRQVYDLSTNKGDLRLFIKYRTDKQKTKKPDYNSWLFSLTESEIALINKDEIKQILERQKSSITISRMKNERAFRIAVGGGRDNSIPIKANRFDESFVS